MPEEIPTNEELPTEEESGIFVYLINIFLVVIIVVLIYKILRGQQTPPLPPPEPELPKMKKRDFTTEELKAYDGNGPDGRILIGVNHKVFDVTKGKRFYGPGGPYAAFAGRDASRAFATFTVAPGKDEYDDLSDLTPAEWESVREWEEQIDSKYTFIGKLLKPGETHTKYEDEEEGKGETVTITATVEEKKEL
ncbi:hypothetical protein WDU94_004251 [Cyamophila willieti]